MKCESCGVELSNQYKFCYNCGKKVPDKTQKLNSGTKLIRLRCSECGGTMDNQNGILFCPFCGSKELIDESDAVKIEQIRNNTAKEIEFEHLKYEKEEKILKASLDEKKAEKKKKSKWSKFFILFVFISALLCFSSFKRKLFLPGLNAGAQAILFFMAWLRNGRQYKILAFVGALLYVPYLNFGGSLVYLPQLNISPRTFEWPSHGLVKYLPEPTTTYGYIWDDDAKEFRIDIEEVDKNDYYNYVEACKNKGFTIKAIDNGDSYTSYNSEGAYLSLEFFSWGEISLELTAPVNKVNINLQSFSFGNQLPDITGKGITDYDHEKEKRVVLYDIAQEQFETLIKTCTDYGYNVEINQSQKEFSAYNTDGYYIHLYFDKSKETVKITASKPYELTTISWPSSPIAKSLPEPKSDLGYIKSDSKDSFHVYIGNTSIDDFNTYVDKCFKKGYDIDHSRSDKSFSADNSTGYELSVKYIGNDVIYISVNYYSWKHNK